MTELTFQLNNEDETIAVGQKLARHIQAPLTLYLTGDLGAGKTTLSRGLIQGLGHKGAVKSPTYTLVEPYELDGVEVYHFDLYRLNDPEELEFMGIRDYFTNSSLCIVEWPDKGEGLLPDADIHLHLNYVNQGREIHIRALTDSGKTLLAAIK